jgi:hypothetical protein
MYRFNEFDQIASKNWNSELLIKPSDSDVYKNWNDCYKYYPEISKTTIEEYHHFQNWLSRVWINIRLNSNNLWTSEITLDTNNIDLWVDIINTKTIKNINFKALHLGNDIEYDSEWVISKVKYVEWKTLLDICNENHNNEELRMNIYNIIKELNNIYWGYYMWVDLWLNMTTENKSDKYQVQWINCKITWIKNWTLFITITDIARNIKEIVAKNQNRIAIILGNI